MMTNRGIGATPTCATKEQHDAAVAACAKYQTVRGVGAVLDPFGSMSACTVAQLPICPTYTRASMNVPPPPPTDTTEPTTSSTSNAVVWGGLILLLVAGGGYAYYKSRK